MVPPPPTPSKKKKPSPLTLTPSLKPPPHLLLVHMRAATCIPIMLIRARFAAVGGVGGVLV